jgi:transcriptional regulator with XRE-family HTH domain
MTHPLKTWREEQKLSQPKAGAKLGVDTMTISRWERGSHLPHKRHWATIEKVTGIAPSELVCHLKTSEVAQ